MYRLVILSPLIVLVVLMWLSHGAIFTIWLIIPCFIITAALEMWLGPPDIMDGDAP